MWPFVIEWGKGLTICICLVAMTLVAYHQMPKLEYIFFDDPGYWLDNLHVHKGLVKENFWWALSNSGEQSNWHPLTWWSHMLDIELFGFKGPQAPNTGGPHVVNLIFHIGNTLLLFLLLRWMTGAAWRSGVVAALFAVHPMHVESVAWVAERKDMLSTFLELLTIAAYFWYVHQREGDGRSIRRRAVRLERDLVRADRGAFRLDVDGQADAGDAALPVAVVGLLAARAAEFRPAETGALARRDAETSRRQGEARAEPAVLQRRDSAARQRSATASWASPERIEQALVTLAAFDAGVLAGPGEGAAVRLDGGLQLHHLRGPAAGRLDGQPGVLAPVAPLLQRPDGVRPLYHRHGLALPPDDVLSLSDEPESLLRGRLRRC